MNYKTLFQILLVGGFLSSTQLLQPSSYHTAETHSPSATQHTLEHIPITMPTGETLVEASRVKVAELVKKMEEIQPLLSPDTIEIESDDSTSSPSQETFEEEENPSDILETEETLPQTPPTQESSQSESVPTYTTGAASSTASAVDGSYFSDAAVIGDSRSQGLMAWGNLGGGANFTGLGLSVYNIWDKVYIDGSLTLMQALSRNQYAKVYVALGINSVGYPSRETFYQKYTNLIQEIKALQPNAVIYVQNIIPVNEAIMKSRGSYDVFNNTVIQEFNSYISRVAKEQGLVYLDIYSYFQDSAGQLPSSASNDGLHLNAEYCRKWADYLKWHTVPTQYSGDLSTEQAPPSQEETPEEYYVETYSEYEDVSSETAPEEWFTPEDSTTVDTTPEDTATELPPEDTATELPPEESTPVNTLPEDTTQSNSSELETEQVTTPPLTSDSPPSPSNTEEEVWISTAASLS